MARTDKNTSGGRSGPLAPARSAGMNKASKARLPKIGRHSSGQARVTIAGRVHYLGQYGSPESMVKFAALLKAHQEGTISPVPHAGQVGTIAGMLDSYRSWIAGTGRYVKRGQPTSEQTIIRNALKSFENFAGSRRVSDLGEPLLLAWRDQLERNQQLTRNGINRKARKVLAAIRWARGRGLVPTGAAASCAMFAPLRRGETGERPETGRLRRAVGLAEVDRVADAIEHQPTALLLRFMARVGCRPGEAAGLRWRDIDETPVEAAGVVLWTMRVAAENAKTSHHGRTISYPLSPAARAILARIPRGTGASHVFAENGVPVNQQKMGREIDRVCRQAGFERFCPHEIRHGAISRACEVGGVLAAMALAGHSKIATTSRYVHADASAAYRVAAALGAG